MRDPVEIDLDRYLEGEDRLDAHEERLAQLMEPGGPCDPRGHAAELEAFSEFAGEGWDRAFRALVTLDSSPTGLIDRIVHSYWLLKAMEMVQQEINDAGQQSDDAEPIPYTYRVQATD